MSRSRPVAEAVVVITGASSGIGRATAMAFARRRCAVVLAARSVDDLHDVATACEAVGGSAMVVETDIAIPTDIDRLAQATVDRYGRVDVWVEAAAVLVAGHLEDHTPDDVKQLVDVNVTGAALGARAALQVFRRQGAGVLVLVSSILGLVPNPLVPAYVMSKFAIRGLALSLRQAVLGDRDIHVCSVLPGPVDTPMFQRAGNRTGRQLRAIPPAAAPERVAAAIVRCATRPRRQTTAGLLAWWVLASHRAAPRVTEWAVAQYSARLLTRGVGEPASRGALAGELPGRTHGGWRQSTTRRHLGERLGRLLAGRRPLG
ncbi:MAG TPA: SDR family NAD(P)-dependent oxidoreductase [Egibacteraceae bacterium]|nr:SDR family NAD(P)-dependent oxidoreductase [Egibacteraceae bacterium]